MKDHLPLYYFSSFGHPLPESVRFAQARFAIGLGLLGLEKKSEARAEFAKAVKLNPNHVAARELAQTED
jgi:TolA-binding protein